MKKGRRGLDRKTRLKKMTERRRREYYEKVVYYRCNLCNERWNIFRTEYRMIEHLLDKHSLRLDEEDKIAFLRKLHGITYLTEKECLEHGIDFNRFKKFKSGE